MVYPNKERNRKIAWSRSGIACHVNPDGRSITLVNLFVHPDTGTWQHHSHYDCYSSSVLSRAFQGRQLTYLTWNPNGTDLLIADESGRMTVIGVSNAINRLTDIKLRPTDAEDTYNTLIGVVWLNSDRSVGCHVRRLRPGI